MFQANQKAVVQNANMVLVNIRTAEVAYFSNFFSNFGTQAAIIAGVISGVISQTPGLENYPCNYFWVFLYFTSSAAALVGASHVLLTTLFTSVYGQGLALRGPLGSMVQTIEGMVLEQHQIVFAFVVTIFFFVLQEAGMFMIVMHETWGVVSAVIVLLGLGVTYHYALRIYNRFHFVQEKADWAQDTDPAREVDQMRSHSDPQHSPKQQRDAAAAASPSSSSSHKHLQTNSQQPLAARQPTEEPSELSLPVSLAAASMEGYLAVKSNRRFTTDPWERRYFVLLGCHVFYYKDKRAYQLAPAEPVNRRPIDLEGYTLVAGAVEPPYAISLIPVDADDIRKAWKFRCDTLAEFNNWIDIFSKALKLAANGEQSDLLVLGGGATPSEISFAD